MQIFLRFPADEGCGAGSLLIGYLDEANVAAVLDRLSIPHNQVSVVDRRGTRVNDQAYNHLVGSCFIFKFNQGVKLDPSQQTIIEAVFRHVDDEDDFPNHSLRTIYSQIKKEFDAVARANAEQSAAEPAHSFEVLPSELHSLIQLPTESYGEDHQVDLPHLSDGGCGTAYVNHRLGHP